MSPNNETAHQAEYRRALRMADAEKHEAAFAMQARVFGLPPLERNYRFDLPASKMEFDYAHLETKVAVEIQGGIWGKIRTGHSTGRGIERDIRKINAAQLKGWVILLLTPKMVQDGSGALMLKGMIERRQGRPPTT